VRHHDGVPSIPCDQQDQIYVLYFLHALGERLGAWPVNDQSHKDMRRSALGRRSRSSQSGSQVCSCTPASWPQISSGRHRVLTCDHHDTGGTPWSRSSPQFLPLSVVASKSAELPQEEEEPSVGGKQQMTLEQFSLGPGDPWRSLKRPRIGEKRPHCP
jgi:hypothetical protein